MNNQSTRRPMYLIGGTRAEFENMRYEMMSRDALLQRGDFRHIRLIDQLHGLELKQNFDRVFNMPAEFRRYIQSRYR